MYHGQQFDSLSNRCSHTGHRVYIYPFEYLTYGVGSAANLITRPTGAKEYKIVDHLGSTRVVLDTAGSVINRTDYEPFGTPIAVTGVDSRKQYIDKELDGESGTANHGVRQYDMVVGAFTSIDPLWEHYRSLTPYQYAANNSPRYLDPDGQKLRFHPDDMKRSDFKEYKKMVERTIEYLNKHKISGAVAELERREEIVYVRMNIGESLYEDETSTIYYDPQAAYGLTNGGSQTPSLVFLHEVGHALQHKKNPDQYNKDTQTSDSQFDTKEERRVNEEVETPAARKAGEDVDTDHNAVPFFVKGPEHREPMSNKEE